MAVMVRSTLENIRSGSQVDTGSVARIFLLAQICTKLFVGWGFAPDPTGGAYSAPPDPLAGLRGLLLKGGEGRDLEVPPQVNFLDPPVFCCLRD